MAVLNFINVFTVPSSVKYICMNSEWVSLNLTIFCTCPFCIFTCMIEHEIYKDTTTEFCTFLLKKHSGGADLLKIFNSTRTGKYTIAGSIKRRVLFMLLTPVCCLGMCNIL